MTQYNGWTNYETWRVNLEIFDGTTLRDLSLLHRRDMWEIKSGLKEYAQELIEQDCKNDLTLSYARAFLDAVDWHEIAQYMLDEYKQDEQDEQDEHDELA